MYNHLMYFAYWVINSFILYLAGVFVPDSVSLGNWRFNSLESALYAGLWLIFLIWVCWDFAIARGFNLKNKTVSFLFFLLANTVSVWVVSRFSGIIGFELVHYQWALAIGFVATILQKIPWKFVGPRN
jgi:hypothetical protein